MKLTREQLIRMIRNNEDVSNVDTSDITDMSFLFENNTIFNQDISKWNVSNVTDMSYMFSYSIFNGDISQWNVTNVTDMSYMFAFSYFNQSLKNWNPISLEKATGMFLNSYCFNQSILFLQNKKLYNIDSLLLYANSYNKDIYLTINEALDNIDIYKCLSCFSDIKNVYPLIYKKKRNFNIFHKDVNFIKNNIFLDE